MAVTVVEGHRLASSTQTGFLLVSTYAWAVITFGFVAMRFVQGMLMRKVKLGVDDIAILAALIFHLGATASAQFTIKAGLGKNFGDLSPDRASLLFKAYYTTTVLSIAVMSCAKVSTACLINRVAPQSKRSKIGLGAMLGTWTIFALFAVAFECGVPQWTVHQVQCGHRGVLIAVIMTNMITDLTLAGWVLPTMWALALNRNLRVLATQLFGLRAIVPVVAVVQLWAAVDLGRSKNPSRPSINLLVTTQAVMSLSIITASIPRINRALGLGGQPLTLIEVRATELSAARNIASQQSAHSEPKLVPSGSGKYSATITSKNPKKNKRKTLPKSADWQDIIMGSKSDDHTSQSSLCEHDKHGGVMLRQEVMVSVGDRGQRHDL